MPSATSSGYPSSLAQGVPGSALKDVPEEPGPTTPSHGGLVAGHEFDLPIAPSQPAQAPPPNVAAAAAVSKPIPRSTTAPSSKPRPMSMPPQMNVKTGSAPSHTHKRSADDGKHRSQDPRRSSSRVVGEYSLGKTLGAGSMGKVKLAYHVHTGERLAVKIVPRPSTPATTSTTPEAQAKQLAKDASKEIRSVREASLSMLLHHPYICGMREFIVQPHNYFMVSEYVNGGQLLDYIISHGRLRERVARKFARQISSALEYCHRNNVVHRDLKIENILISANGNIKLIDFGLSNLYNPASHLSTFCGSLYFAAPELLNAKVYTGPEVDVWSFGVVLYVLVCGKVPFDDQSMPALHAKIKRGVVEYPVWLSADCKSLLGRILVTNPTLRATMHEIFHHPWMLRGHSGPQSVHCPKRTPLRVEDIDPAVVRGMTGFEFGSEKDITRKLTAVLESDAYQRILRRSQDSSSTIVHPAADESPSKKTRRFSGLGFDFYRKKLFPSSKTSNSSGSSNGTVTNGAFPHAGSTSSIFDPSSIAASLDIDATRGFHPLISIYFLVREKMERERVFGHHVFASSKMSLEEAEAEKERQRALEPIAIPESSLVHNGVEAVPPAQLSPLAAAHPSPRAKAPEDALSALPSPAPSSPARTVGHGGSVTLRAPPASTHRRSQSLSQRPSALSPWARTGEHGERLPQEPPKTAGPAIGSFSDRERERERGKGDSEKPIPDSASGKGATFIRRFGSMLDGRERRRASLLIPRQSVDEQREREEREDRDVQQETVKRGVTPSQSMPLPRASAAEKERPAEKSAHKRAATVLEAQGHTTLHNRRGSVGPGLGLFGANTIGRRWNPGGHSTRPSVDREREERHDNEETTTDDDALEQTDKDFKPVFMKGLFSVQTTSTKPPAVLHADIRRVLDRMQIQHREIKGGFECMHAPSIDLASVVPPSPLSGHSREPSGQKLSKKTSKLSFVNLRRSDADSIRSRNGLDTEKDLPPRPSIGVSRSGSSFLNIGGIASAGPASPAGAAAENDDARSQRSQVLINGQLNGNGMNNGPPSTSVSRSASPTKGRFTQPIPRDFAASPIDRPPTALSLAPEKPAVFEDNNSNPLGVRFEVHVVKVPLLPLYGIQFRRVSGDVWQYQMLARRVLTELKL